MNEADWAIVAALVISGLISLWRGFVKEALSLVIWSAALIIAVLFHQPLAEVLSPHIETPSLRDIVAIAILFFSTLIVGSIIRLLISGLVNATGLSGTDRFLGLLFGLLRAVVVILAILITLPDYIPIDQDGWWQESALIPQFLKMESWFKEIVDAIKDLYSSILG